MLVPLYSYCYTHGTEVANKIYIASNNTQDDETIVKDISNINIMKLQEELARASEIAAKQISDSSEVFKSYGYTFSNGKSPFPYFPGMHKKEGWTVKFFNFDKSVESLIPLLNNMLPFQSTVTPVPELSAIAVYSSPEGIDTAQDFFIEIEQMKEKAEEKTVFTTQGEWKGISSLQNVMLEILILEGIPKNDSEFIDFSPEAKILGITPEDLAFLGNRYWKTYGNGLITVNTSKNNNAPNEFETIISSSEVYGEAKTLNQKNMALHIVIKWEIPDPLDAAGYIDKGIETNTNITLGQTTLIGTTNNPESNLLTLIAVRANRTDIGESDYNNKLDTVIPNLNVENVITPVFANMLGKASGINIITTSNASRHTINANLKNATVRTILDTVLPANGLCYVEKPDNVIVIMPEKDCF